MTNDTRSALPGEDPILVADVITVQNSISPRLAKVWIAIDRKTVLVPRLRGLPQRAAVPFLMACKLDRFRHVVRQEAAPSDNLELLESVLDRLICNEQRRADEAEQRVRWANARRSSRLRLPGAAALSRTHRARSRRTRVVRAAAKPSSTADPDGSSSDRRRALRSSAGVLA